MWWCSGHEQMHSQEPATHERLLAQRALQNHGSVSSDSSPRSSKVIAVHVALAGAILGQRLRAEPHWAECSAAREQ